MRTVRRAYMVVRATYFCRTPDSPLAKLSLLTDPICLSLPPLAIRDSVPSFILAERTASPFYPLSFILYPLYPGLPR